MALAALLALAAPACQVPEASATLELAGQAYLAENAPACLRFRPPAQGDFTAFVLEVRQLPDGAWRATSTQVPGVDTTDCYPAMGPEVVRHHFQPTDPDGASYELRVRTFPDRGGQRVSAPVRVQREPIVPTVAKATPPNAVGLILTPRSPAATHYQITRTMRVCDGPEGPGETFTVPASTTTWQDPGYAEFQDGATFLYRVASLQGETLSVSRARTGADSPKNDPAVTTTLSGLEVRLALTNRSRCSIKYLAYRLRLDLLSAPGELLRSGSLPAGVGASVEWVHTVPSGAWRFLVVDGTGIAGKGFAGSPGTFFDAPFDPTTLKGTLQETASVEAATWLPGGETAGLYRPASLDPVPSWALAVGAAGDRTTLLLAAAPAILSGPRQVAVDAGGWPHFLVDQQQVLNHTWLDDQGWHTEELGPLDGTHGAELVVGADGSLVRGWWGRQGLTLGRRDPSGWAVIPFGDPSKTLLGLTADAAGRLHLLTAGLGQAWPGDYWYQSDAGWVMEPLQLVEAYAQALTSWDGRIVLAYESPRGTFWMADREAAGWGTPIPLGNASNPSAPFDAGRLSFARSVDGRRLLLADVTQRRLWVREAGGITSWSWRNAYQVVGIGFSPAGKVRVITGGGRTPVLYEEP